MLLYRLVGVMNIAIGAIGAFVSRSQRPHAERGRTYLPPPLAQATVAAVTTAARR